MNNNCKILEFSREKIIQGHPIFTITCPICKSNSQVVIDKKSLVSCKLQCSDCMQTLSFNKEELIQIVKAELLHMAERIEFEANEDNTISLSQSEIELQQNHHETSVQANEVLLMHFLIASKALAHIVPVYFVKLRSDRIGHLILNTACFLVKLQTEGRLSSSLIFAYPTEPVCNKSLVNFWMRYMHMPIWVEYAYSICTNSPNLEYMCFDLYGSPISEDELIDYRYYYEQNLVNFEFSKEEHHLAKSELQGIGVEQDSPYVCFLGRDPQYLIDMFPNSDFKYHDIRNMDIHSFLPAMHYFAKQKIYSLRVGNVVQHVLNENSPYILDCSNGRVSDLLDFYIPANCALCIGILSGIIDAAHLRNIPTLYVNCNLYAYTAMSLSTVTIIYKKYYYIPKKQYLSYEFVIANDIHKLSPEELASLEIHWQDNSPKEIYEAAMETWQRIQGTFPPPELQEKYDAIQLKYRAILDKYPEKRTYQGYISQHKAHSHIPLCFVNSNPWFLA